MRSYRLHFVSLLAAALAASCGDEPKAPPRASTPMQEKAAVPKGQPTPAPVAQPKIEEAPANANPNTLLANRVKRALEDSSVQAAGIDVTASNGVISLFGTVTNDDERKRAASIAGKVQGVTSVDNRLVIIKGS